MTCKFAGGLNILFSSYLVISPSISKICIQTIFFAI